MTGEFDWTGDDAIVCEHKPALTAYANPRDQAVIWQEASWCDAEDHVVLVNREYIIGIAYALLDQLEGAFENTERVAGGWCDVPRAEPAKRRPEPEAGSEPLALPAPDHKREAVTPDLSSGRGT